MEQLTKLVYAAEHGSTEAMYDMVEKPVNIGKKHSNGVIADRYLVTFHSLITSS